MKTGDVMQEWMAEFVNQFGYAGVLLLIAIETIFPPIPSEVILTFSGFLTTYTTMSIWGVVVSATIGSITGAMVLYGIGRWLNPHRLQHWLNGRIGRLLHFNPNDVERAVGWFSRKGASAVFFCRFIPIIRSLISIPAGISRINIWKFLVLTGAGTVIWNFILVYAGSLAGESWDRITNYMDVYASFALAILIVLALLLVFLFYKKRF
jgi:membrane protein DedA with SNARE-associated domain